MFVRDLMTLSVTTVSPLSSVAEVIDVMRREDTGIVPVCDLQNHLLGLITDRDIILRSGLMENKTAEAIMTTKIVSVSPKEDIHKAALILSENSIRRLPVIENDHLVGMLSLRDLAKKKVMTAEIGHIIYNVCNHSRP